MRKGSQSGQLAHSREPESPVNPMMSNRSNDDVQKSRTISNHSISLYPDFMALSPVLVHKVEIKVTYLVAHYANLSRSENEEGVMLVDASFSFLSDSRPFQGFSNESSPAVFSSLNVS